jgi:hypothetical protein
LLREETCDLLLCLLLLLHPEDPALLRLLRLQGRTALCRDALCERGVPPRAPCNGSLPLDRL